MANKNRKIVARFIVMDSYAEEKEKVYYMTDSGMYVVQPEASGSGLQWVTTMQECFASLLAGCDCLTSVLTFKWTKDLQITLDGQILSIFIHEILKSSSFRSCVLNNLLNVYRSFYNENQFTLSSCNSCQSFVYYVPILLNKVWPKQCIMDKSWGYRVEKLVHERCELENALSWLSTLGGAFSSLGDYSLYFAEQASKVSSQQLKLALMLDDPLLVCRCKIFIAMSILQKGHIKAAKKLVKEQYKFAITKGRIDFRLANMCKAVWLKAKYLQHFVAVHQNSLSCNVLSAIEN